jgi:hypothetical protein
MSVTHTPTRRVLTVIAVAASLLLGFGAIRASAAWTAAAAPISVAPISVDTLKVRLADESDRSAALLDRLTTLTSHADELSAALVAAKARIGEDAAHADQLAKDLAAAKEKLAALEKSIKQANSTKTVVVKTTTTHATSAPASHGDDGEGGDD